MRESLLTSDEIFAKYPHLSALAKQVNVAIGDYSIWNFWWHRLGEDKVLEIVAARKKELAAGKRKLDFVEVHEALRKALPDRAEVVAELVTEEAP